MRHEVIARQLDRHLPDPPGRFVDLGAGVGWQGVRLARLGFEVTLLDLSEKKLAVAERVLAGEAREVAERVELIHGTIENAPALLRDRTYGVVLCHAVLPLIADASGLFATLSTLCQSGATVSIIAKNADALAMRAGLQGRFDHALELFEGKDEQRDDGAVLVGHTVAGLSEAASSVGIEVDSWYGVGVFTAHRRDPPNPDRLVPAVELETRAGAVDPYRQVARQIHLVGRA